jgi:hypothetical protein
MAERLWQTITWSLLIGIILSFALELLLNPRPLLPWQRPCSAVMLHLGIWLMLYSPLLMLLRRPWFASFSLLAFQILVIQISNAKYRSLREPFTYQDFSYFVDAILYPRLYLPFLGVWSSVMVIFAVGMAAITGLLIEQPSAMQLAGVGSMVTIITGAGLALLGAIGRVRLLLDPGEDLANLGLLPSLWHYGFAERQPWKGRETTCFSTESHQTEGVLPNLVAIQSESFFDARRWNAGISPELLRNFDNLRQSSVLHGQLEVPAWGANTVRTEFAFLSGIANDQLGIHRFNPYRRLARQGLPTLVGYLKKLGYRTVCLHPYSAQFYGRDKVFTQMGFDEFIDISRFSGSDYVGQYVGDVAVAREVCGELARHDGSESLPVFLFVITMENHGPLHLEQALPEDRQRLYTTGQPQGCDDLTVYLRHLEQADQMFGSVQEQLESMGRGGWLCLYGDHLPIMPEVFRRLGAPDGTTDYLVWSNQQQAGTLSSSLKVEQLPVLLAQFMGSLCRHESR